MTVSATIPIPPLEMRQLVGRIEPEAFDNPDGSLVYPEVDAELYDEVFDFGCGCGRVARQLMLQRRRPLRYVGIDLHRGMVEWCRANLTPAAPEFSFLHHDVLHVAFNPGDKGRTQPFPPGLGSFTLVNANSVFTHMTQEQARFYLFEVAKILRPEGVARTTWFLFDKALYPMLQDEQNALYVAYEDPAAASLFARDWVVATAREAGLVVYRALPPEIRGFQWTLLLAPAAAGRPAVDLPPDEAPVGLARPPRGPDDPSRVGVE